ncbi:SMC family, C-terminal domain containing protein [Trichomonas vaginalis G3]|uniref:SMC family, C-terminal domain containing protein n=1 Tax=Trichomonas vaginalis (strain ATCC PRA-98 / G3) TaxID=412133 RepID=A2DQN6_TRIV3|nr:SMC family, C-terminal domain containing protein [Trichomonas vaginalis G3]|eukprot:XP_001329543.1 SMC family, C-terminal domain containing protein [Trichomonas vaginalis G3]
MRRTRREQETIYYQRSKKTKHLVKIFKYKANELVDKLATVDNSLQNSEQDLRNIRAELTREEERKAHYERSIEDTNMKIESNQNASNLWKKRLEDYEKESQDIEKEIAELPDPGDLREDIKKYNSIRAQANKQYSDLANSLSDATKERDLIQNEVDQMQKDRETQEESLTRTRDTLSKIEEDTKKNNSLRQTVVTRKNELDSQLKMMRVSDTNDKDNQKKLTEKLSEIEKKYDDLRRAQGTAKHKERFLKAITALQRLIPGVYGTLGQLCKPAKSTYEKAFLNGLADWIDALVVKDRQVGQRCLEYFKEQGAGKLLVIPLKGLPTPQRKNLTGITYLAKIITVSNAEYQPAVDYACGNIVLAKDFDQAQDYAFNRGLNCVTAEGTTFDKNGIITTGSSRENTTFAISSIQDLEKQKTKIERELQETSERIEIRRNEFNRLEEELGTVMLQIEGFNRKLSELSENKKLYDSNLRTIQRGIKELNQSTEEKKKSLETAQAKYEELAKKQAALDKKLFADIVLKTGQSIQEIESTYHRRTMLENRLEYIKSVIPNEQNDDPQKVIDELNQRLQEYKESNEQSQKNIDELKQREEESKKKVNKYKDELTQLHEEDERMREELKELNRTIRSQQEDLEGINNSFNEYDHDVRTATQQLSMVFQRCLLDNVELPHNGDYRKEITSTLSTDSQAVEDLEQVKTIDFKSLSSASKSVKWEKFNETVDRYEKDLAKVRAEISQIHPDLRSEDKAKGVEEELEKMKNESDQMAKEAKDKKKKFNEMREERRTKFMELYDALDETINPIYQMFTRRGSHNEHSGVAYLAMEDTDEPYLGGIKYTAMPPHKRFRDLEQLSGGEKAVASLALVVALQKFLDAPFIILDEPDASLDKINLKAAAMALRELSEEEDGSQIICVSLRDRFFEFADSLAGVFKEIQTTSSGVLTINLTQFREQSLKMDEI